MSRNKGYGDDLPNALRLACKEWAHAWDYVKLVETIRKSHGYAYPHHTALGYRFVGQMLHWKATVLELSGTNYDFVEAVDGIIEDDSFETELNELLVKFKYKKGKKECHVRKST
jgi:hypothetical protein